LKNIKLLTLLLLLIPLVTSRISVASNNITQSNDIQPMGGWKYLAGWLPYPGCEPWEEYFGDVLKREVVTIFLIMDFRWAAPYTGIRVYVLYGTTIVDDLGTWYSGGNGGYVPYYLWEAHENAPAATGLLFTYYEYYGEGNPPEISFTGYCEYGE
jgi:hypothetical protein